MCILALVFELRLRGGGEVGFRPIILENSIFRYELKGGLGSVRTMLPMGSEFFGGLDQNPSSLYFRNLVH